MSWTIIPFGKHKGKTFPQIMFSDPDWFFWAFETGVFDTKWAFLKREAVDIYGKAQNIKIPSPLGDALVVEYTVHSPTGTFQDFRIVSKGRTNDERSSSTFTGGEVIDLSIPRQFSSYDKFGCKNMLQSLKFCLFGNERLRMTKQRCEAFYDDSENFG